MNGGGSIDTVSKKYSRTMVDPVLTCPSSCCLNLSQSSTKIKDEKVLDILEFSQWVEVVVLLSLLDLLEIVKKIWDFIDKIRKDFTDTCYNERSLENGFHPLKCLTWKKRTKDKYSLLFLSFGWGCQGSGTVQLTKVIE